MLHHVKGNFEHFCNLLIMVLFSENKFVFLALLQYIYFHGRVLHTFLDNYAPNGLDAIACPSDARAVLRAPVLTCIHRPFGA